MPTLGTVSLYDWAFQGTWCLEGSLTNCRICLQFGNGPGAREIHWEALHGSEIVRPRGGEGPQTCWSGEAQGSLRPTGCSSI